LSIITVTDVNKQVIQTKDANLLLVGARGQNKTDIFIKKLIYDLEKNNFKEEEIICLVADDNQVFSLRRKIKNYINDKYDNIKIHSFLDFFHQLYQVTSPKNESMFKLVNLETSESQDWDKIMELMEICYTQVGLNYGKVPVYEAWKNYVQSTYSLRTKSISINKDINSNKKMEIFCRKFHSLMIENKLMTEHYLVNLLILNLRNKEGRSKLKEIIGNTKIFYIDDAHFLSKVEWSVLLKIIKEKKAQVMCVCDMYFIPERILGIGEDGKIGIDFLLQQFEMSILKLKEKISFSSKQKNVYQELWKVMRPIIPIVREDTSPPHDVKELDLFGDQNKLKLTMILITLIQALKKDANEFIIYQNNVLLIAHLEALLAATGIPFYRKTNSTFWTAPHNSFLSCYVSFLNGQYDYDDISYFFENAIYKYYKFEEKANTYLRDVIDMGIENANIYQYFDSSNPDQGEFIKTMHDIKKLSYDLKKDLPHNIYRLFENTWVRKFVGAEEGQRIEDASNYVEVMHNLFKLIPFPNLDKLCSFINALENREFYNPKDGVLICDYELFNYKKYDNIIFVTKVPTSINSLASLDNKTLQFIYQAASTFKKSITLFAEIENKSTFFEDKINQLLKELKH